MRNLRVLVVCKNRRNSNEKKVYTAIAMAGFDVKHVWKNNLKKSELENIDFVVAVGGDGTALSAAHYLFGKPILIINSDPKLSEGALSTVSIENFEKKIDEIKNQKYFVEKLERIEIFINGKVQYPLALNEVFIANEKAYLMSRYILAFEKEGKRVREEQRSSGVIFSTGVGSTAWFKSAGGEPFSQQSRFIRMIVREPYLRNLKKFEHVKENIREGENVEVIPLTNSVLAVDSIREFRLKKGDKVKIKISDNPLLRVC